MRAYKEGKRHLDLAHDALEHAAKVGALRSAADVMSNDESRWVRVAVLSGPVAHEGALENQRLNMRVHHTK